MNLFLLVVWDFAIWQLWQLTPGSQNDITGFQTI
jgi:hypothetical protein